MSEENIELPEEVINNLQDVEYVEEELTETEKQIVAAVSARDIHVLTAVAYSVGEMYGKLKKNVNEEELETEYNKGYVQALSEIYEGIINHINELTEKYQDYFNLGKKENITVFDHQNETPQEEN